MQSEQERRTILAVGLSLMVYMVYLQWFAPPLVAPIPAEDAAIAVATDGPAADIGPVGVPAS